MHLDNAGYNYRPRKETVQLILLIRVDPEANRLPQLYTLPLRIQSFSLTC